MKRFLKYTWPILAYIFLWFILIYVPTNIDYFTVPDFLSLLPHPFVILFNLGGIYYLWTSPFGKTQHVPLTIILICRFIIHSHFWVSSNINAFLHISVELFLLIFYSLRSFEKRKLKTDDLIKLIFIIFLTIETIETYLIRVIFLDLLPEYEWVFLYDYLRYYFYDLIILFQGILLLLHITMLYKRKDVKVDNHEEKLIEDLGKGSN